MSIVEGFSGGRPAGRVRDFKRRLAQRAVLVGAWQTIPEQAVSEIMAGAGFDFVVIDGEHSPWTVIEIQRALASYSTSTTVVFVRVPDHDPAFIKRVLDVGVDGIMCPVVRTAEEAAALVAACRYPPRGIRGFGPRRVADYGRTVDSYVPGAEDDILVMPQIEDVAYAHEAIAVMDTDGVDLLSMGPTDLSGTMGRLRDYYHPEVQAVIDPILQAAVERGKGVCTGIVVGPDEATGWIAKGARLPIVTIDTTLLVEGAREAIAATKAAWAAERP